MTNHSIRPNSLRALKSLSVNGPSTIAELDKFDPTNGDHKAIVKGLIVRLLISSDCTTRLPHEPTRYSLTNRGRSALLPKPHVRAPQPKGGKQAADAPQSNVAGPLRHGSLSTSGSYQPGKDMLAPAARPGADAALAIPSRHGNQLHYRDGRVSQITSLQPT